MYSTLYTTNKHVATTTTNLITINGSDQAWLHLGRCHTHFTHTCVRDVVDLYPQGVRDSRQPLSAAWRCCICSRSNGARAALMITCIIRRNIQQPALNQHPTMESGIQPTTPQDIIMNHDIMVAQSHHSRKQTQPTHRSLSTKQR